MEPVGCSSDQNKNGFHSVNILELVKLFQNLFASLLLLETITLKQAKALNQENYMKRNPDEKKYQSKKNTRLRRQMRKALLKLKLKG